MSVIVATAYMEEAAGFDWLVAMDGGKILATGSACRTSRAHLRTQSRCSLYRAPAGRKAQGYHESPYRAAQGGGEGDYAIEASHLSMRFGDFTAVDNVSFKIPRGEIYRLSRVVRLRKIHHHEDADGLLAASEGEAKLFGTRWMPAIWRSVTASAI